MTTDEIFLIEEARNVVRLSAMPDPYLTKSGDVVTGCGMNPLGSEDPEGKGLETVSHSLLAFSESVASMIPSLALGATESLVGKLGLLSGTRSDGVENVADCAIDALSEGAKVMQKCADIENTKFSVTSKARRNRQNKEGDRPSQWSEDDKQLEHDLGNNEVDALDSLYAEPEVAEPRNLRLEFRSPSTEENSPCTDATDQEKEEKLIRMMKLDEYLSISDPVDNEDESVSEASVNTMDSTNMATTTRSLTYGPPSETSIQSVASKNQAIDEPPAASVIVFEDQNQYLEQEEVMTPATGNWIRVKLPCNLKSFTVVTDKVFVTDAMKNVYIGRLLSCDKIVWRKEKFQADHIFGSPNGTILWRTLGGTLFVARPLRHDLSDDSWFEVQKDVNLVALGDSFAYIVKQDGCVLPVANLSASRPFTPILETLSSPDDLPMEKVTLTEGFVIGLTKEGRLLGRTGISRSNPRGNNEWIDIASLSTSVAFKDFDLYQQLVGTQVVFKIITCTKTGRLLYAHGSLDDILFDTHLPWSDVITHSFGGADKVNLLARFSESFLFTGMPGDGEIFCNTSRIQLHRWQNLNLHCSHRSHGLRIKNLSAKGVFQHEGVFWASSNTKQLGNGDLYFTKFHDETLHRVKLPRSVKLLAFDGAPEAFWVLSTSGQVFARTGITEDKSEGDSWQKVDLGHMKGVVFKSISLGSDRVWAVDDQGKAWMKEGLLNTVHQQWSLSTWSLVGNSDAERAAPYLTKICCSSVLHIVGALDSQKSLHVREGIFPDLTRGLNWIQVGGEFDIADMATSESAIWVLTTTGKIFRRCGLTPTNFIGDSWQQITLGEYGQMTSLSVTVCDRAFAVNESGEVVELVNDEVSLSLPKTRSHARGGRRRIPEISDEKIDGDWSLVM